MTSGCEAEGPPDSTLRSSASELDFADQVGHSSIAGSIRDYKASHSAQTTLMITIGIPTWVAGGALVFVGAQTDSDLLLAPGALALMGGQILTVAGLVMAGVRRNKLRRLDPWIPQRDSERLADEHNRALATELGLTP